MIHTYYHNNINIILITIYESWIEFELLAPPFLAETLSRVFNHSPGLNFFICENGIMKVLSHKAVLRIKRVISHKEPGM